MDVDAAVFAIANFVGCCDAQAIAGVGPLFYIGIGQARNSSGPVRCTSGRAFYWSNRGGGSRRRLARAIKHPFKSPHGDAQKPSDSDRRNFAAGGGVIGAVAGQPEVSPPRLWDRQR
jgi:hypothetical protein